MASIASVTTLKRTLSLNTLPTEVYIDIVLYMLNDEISTFFDMLLCKSHRNRIRDENFWEVVIFQQKRWKLPSGYLLPATISSFRVLLYTLNEVEAWPHTRKTSENVPFVLQTIVKLSEIPHIQTFCLDHIGKLSENESARSLLGKQLRMEKTINKEDETPEEEEDNNNVNDNDKIKKNLNNNAETGVEVILNSMRQFPNDAKIQGAGCRALVTAARPIGGLEGRRFQGDKESVSIGSRIFQLGGDQIVLKAMSDHISDPEVQAMACWSLVNLSLVSEQKTQIVNSNGIQKVIDAMRFHKNKREVQFRAIFALVNLVISERDLNDMPIDTVPLILETLSTFRQDEDLVSRVCLVLRNLSCDRNNIHILRNSTTEQELILAFRANSNNSIIIRLIQEIIERIRIQNLEEDNFMRRETNNMISAH